MTIPWMMNCPHSDDSWCLDCASALGEVAVSAEAKLREAADRIDALEADLATARETNRRLNARCQDAERAIPDYRKLLAVPPDGDGLRFVSGNLGRALMHSMCHKQQEQIGRLEAGAAASAVSIELNQQERASAVQCLREIAAMGRKAGSETAQHWLLQHGYPLEDGGYVPGAQGFGDAR